MYEKRDERAGEVRSAVAEDRSSGASAGRRALVGLDCHVRSSERPGYCSRGGGLAGRDEWSYSQTRSGRNMIIFASFGLQQNGLLKFSNTRKGISTAQAGAREVRGGY